MMKRLILLTLAVVALMGSSRGRDAYVISGGDNNTYKSDSSLDELLAVRKVLTGRYMWVRRDGREYVIRDEATLERIETFFEPLKALRPEQKAASREEARLDREVDRLEDDDHLSRADRQRLVELRQQLRDASERERELDEKEEALERNAERALWAEVDSAIRAGRVKPSAVIPR